MEGRTMGTRDELPEPLFAVPSPGTPGEGQGGGSRDGRSLSDDAAAQSPHPGPPPEYREREKSAEYRESEEVPETSGYTADEVLLTNDDLIALAAFEAERRGEPTFDASLPVRVADKDVPALAHPPSDPQSVG